MMKLALLVVFLVVATYAKTVIKLDQASLRQSFLEFQRKFNRTYETQEEANKRFAIFTENMNTAQHLNELNPRASFGVNLFADISKEEFRKTHLNNGYDKNHKRAPAKTVFPKRNLTAVGIKVTPNPTNFDWGSAGVITPVYDQGQCGSCWAFSATETIESYYALAGGALTGLSMEQIVDCDTTDGGCNGGNTNTAYDYVESAPGIDSYQSYPYTAGGGQSGQCSYQSSTVTTVTNYNSVNGEDGLYQQSSTAGPVSVCVDASSWQSYSGGVLTSCGSDIDHCVQLTGYTSYGQSGAAWNVRNSWSTSWGTNGYIYIAIGQDLCAIGDDATIVQT
jgi:C1A family cysteine protease